MLNEPHSRNLVSSLLTSIAPFSSLTRTRVLLAVAILLPATLPILTSISSAASPSTGTISAASGPLSYTAGPFVVANESGQGGVVTPVCQPGTPLCDEYTLTVNASSLAAGSRIVSPASVTDEARSGAGGGDCLG